MAAAALVTAGCGSSDDPVAGGGTGLVTLTLSDPPTCQVPAGDFVNVYVTVTRVRAHISAGAGDTDDGWVDLVDRTADPVQVDLLSNPDTTCVLSVLGSSMGLPPGDYQQIRFHLLSNNPPPEAATPATNACGIAGFNCAVQSDGSVVPLDLSSQDQTGLKVPPGRIAGGAISLQAGQSADINIDFNICASFVRLQNPAGVPVRGPQGFRMRPTLYAGEVSLTTNSISGRVVDLATSNPLVDATIMVFAQQPDAGGIGRVILQTRANATEGTFQLCPLPDGNYDIAITAMDGSGVTHHPAIALEVPSGSDLGDIPMVAQPAPGTAPGQLDGQVTSQATGGTPTSVNAVVYALQPATPPGGAERLVSIPPLGNSTVVVATAPGGTCPASTECADYILFVPAGNPSIGTFDIGGTTFSIPASAPNLYRVNAETFLPGTGHEPTCTPSSLTVDTDSTGAALAVTAGVATTPATFFFTGCTASTP